MGRLMVQPSAWPRLTIVTLCTGSVCSRVVPTSAWPISWNAMVSFSFSLIIRLFRSGAGDDAGDRLLEVVHRR